MIECEEYHDIIMLHFDGDLREDQTKTLKTHLSTCRDCNRLFTQLEAVVNGLEEATAPTPDTELEKMAMNRIMSLHDSELNEGLVFSELIRVPLIGLTAALLFLSGMFIGGIDIVQLAAWAGNLTEAVSIIFVDIQIVYHILADLFPWELFSFLSGIQIILVSALCFTVILVLKSVFGQNGRTIGIS